MITCASIFLPRRAWRAPDFLALDDVHEDVAEGYIPVTDANERITGWKRNRRPDFTPAAAADGGPPPPWMICTVLRGAAQWPTPVHRNDAAPC
ncbi:MAG: hypothetical protein R2911_11110 [Caldilineaceae bacterium]